MKIIKVTQDDCRPCGQLAMFLNNMGFEVDEEINISHDEEGKKYATETLGVMSTPQLFLLDDEGKVVDKVVGVNFGEVELLFEKYEG